MQQVPPSSNSSAVNATVVASNATVAGNATNATAATNATSVVGNDTSSENSTQLAAEAARLAEASRIVKKIVQENYDNAIMYAGTVYSRERGLGPVGAEDPVPGLVSAEYGTELVYSGPVEHDEYAGEYASVEYAHEGFTRSSVSQNRTGTTIPDLPAVLNCVSDNTSYISAADIGANGQCVSWGNPASIRTFDRKGYSFQGHGEFILFKHRTLDQQVNIIQHRVNQLARNTGVAFRSSGKIFSIQMERVWIDANTTAVQPVLRYEGADISKQVMAESSAQMGPFTFGREGKLDGTPLLMLQIANNQSTTVVITVQSRGGMHHFDVFVEVPGNSFALTSGLCGSFDLDVSNDLETITGSIVNEPVAMALSWMMKNESMWGVAMNIPNADVLTDVITPNSLGKSRYDVIEAVRACLEVGSEYRVACTFNVLAGGLIAADEAYQVERITSDTLLSIDEASTMCLKSKFSLSPWRLYGPCSAQCGNGFRTRQRLIYALQEKDGAEIYVNCGNITQTNRCFSACGM